MEGENRLRGDPERNEIDGFGDFVFVPGGSLFGGEKGQRPSAPSTPRQRRSTPRGRPGRISLSLFLAFFHARRIVTSGQDPPPWLMGGAWGALRSGASRA